MNDNMMKNECPVWMDWIENRFVSAGDLDLLRALIRGLGDGESGVYFFWGLAGSGKSTLARLLMAMLPKEEVLSLDLGLIDRRGFRHLLKGVNLWRCAEFGGSARDYLHLGLVSRADLIESSRRTGENEEFRFGAKVVIETHVSFLRRKEHYGYNIITFRDQGGVREYGYLEALLEEVEGIKNWAFAE